MANITFGDELGGYKWLGDYFDWDLSLESSSGTEARYTDNVTGSHIVLTGTGLQFTNDSLTAGNVSGVQLLDENDNILLDLTGGSFGPDDLDFGDFWAFVSSLTAGNDTLTGNDLGTDMNLGDNHGNDTLIAGDGGSYMAGSEGDDSYTGGADWDTLSYEDAYWQEDAKHGVILNVAKGTVTDAWRDKDTFSGIEEFRGTQFKDVLTGSTGEEAFMGMEGADKIKGGAGADTVRYHRDQSYDGNKGIVADLDKGIVIDGFGDKDSVSKIENVFGTYKADKFIGDDQDNQFRGLSGKDSFSGGKGTDVVSFDWWEDLGQHGVDVDLSLAKNQIKDDGFDNVETTKGIEAVEGSALGDTLKLGKSNGWAWGGDGDDTLTAGVGNQWFGGGNGADSFVFETLASLGAGDNRDEIDDFSQADGDTIDLSGIGGLMFIGTSAFMNMAGELRYEQVDGSTIIYGDTDGDGTANFQLKINLIVDLVDGDFVL
jgi:serralysin